MGGTGNNGLQPDGAQGVQAPMGGSSSTPGWVPTAETPVAPLGEMAPELRPYEQVMAANPVSSGPPAAPVGPSTGMLAPAVPAEGFNHSDYPQAATGTPGAIHEYKAPVAPVAEAPKEFAAPTSFVDPRGLTSNPTRMAEIRAAGPDWFNNNDLVRSVLQDMADRGGDWRATSVPGNNNWYNPILQYLKPETKIYWPGDPARPKGV